MQFIINELSFIGQAKNEHEADNLMKVMSELIKELKPIHKSTPIRIHKSFCNCQLSPGITVDKWIRTKLQSPREKDIGRFFVVLASKGPFIDDIEEITQELTSCWKCYLDEEDITDSSLTTAAYLNRKGALVSLQKAPNFSFELIPVKFCKDGEIYEYIQISNLTHANQACKLRRTYAPSPKHAAGGWGTLMDLSDELAQKVLDNGICGPSKQIYGYCNGKFYEFQPDNAGGYHGYPVNDTEIPPMVYKELKQMHQ